MPYRRTLAATVAATFALVGAAAAGAAYEAPDNPASSNDTTFACTTPAPAWQYAWYHCYTPSDITSAYGVNALQSQGVLGQGQTIVLVDAYGSPTAASDLQFFHDTFYRSLPNPSFKQIYPNGNSDGSGDPAGGSGPATLDVEWSYAIAPRAHIVLMAVPPTQDLPSLIASVSNEIDATPPGTVFSIGLAVSEQPQLVKLDAVFRKGIAKGDTFFAPSGDDGSRPVAWPASSPYVTAVGGTQLQHGWTWSPSSDVAESPSYFASTTGGNRNAVWNESWLPAASGGGPSTIYPRPSWQSGVAAVIGSNARGVPDLAWNAAVNGGVLVYLTAFPQDQRAGWHVYGGTSAAAPQVAALTALAEQKRASAHKPPLGNIDALLYSHPKWFTDIAPVTEGTALSGQLVNNREWDDNVDGGWPTLTGYDMTTGLGTPNAPAYVKGLAGS
ncbi:MAG: S53 family peptidase [Gaiellaceae bacterium]